MTVIVYIRKKYLAREVKFPSFSQIKVNYEKQLIEQTKAFKMN